MQGFQYACAAHSSVHTTPVCVNCKLQSGITDLISATIRFSDCTVQTAALAMARDLAVELVRPRTDFEIFRVRSKMRHAHPFALFADVSFSKFPCVLFVEPTLLVSTRESDRRNVG